jgi:nitroimidazol reductase NimA-like FMN-containing flavoprotein (pyridoxamine 5'-phosphate oxidase superfamily)
MSEPTPSRIRTPGYGFENAKRPPGEKLPWSRVSEVFAAARNYWIATARPDGRPHAAPVWGIWLDGIFYFSTGKESRKARNLAAIPSVAVHIEGAGGEVIILEGTAKEISNPSVLRPVWDAYKAKYNWGVESYPFFVVRPTVAFSFLEELGDTATRWAFAAESNGP